LKSTAVILEVTRLAQGPFQLVTWEEGQALLLKKNEKNILRRIAAASSLALLRWHKGVVF
jgi:hypothetical protein